MRRTATEKVRAVKACFLRVFCLRKDLRVFTLKKLNHPFLVPEEGAGAMALGLSWNPFDMLVINK